MMVGIETLDVSVAGFGRIDEPRVPHPKRLACDFIHHTRPDERDHQTVPTHSRLNEHWTFRQVSVTENGGPSDSAEATPNPLHINNRFDARDRPVRHLRSVEAGQKFSGRERFATWENLVMEHSATVGSPGLRSEID